MSEYIFVTNIFEYSNIRIYSSHSGPSQYYQEYVSRGFVQLIENKKCWNVCFLFSRICIFLHSIDSILRLPRKKDHRHRIKSTLSDFSPFLHQTVFSGFLHFGFLLLLINTCIQFFVKTNFSRNKQINATITIWLNAAMSFYTSLLVLVGTWNLTMYIYYCQSLSYTYSLTNI